MVVLLKSNIWLSVKTAQWDNIQDFSVNNSKVIQIRLKPVLGGEAGVHQEPFFPIPFFEAAVVEQLQIVLDDKGDNVVFQTLLKENQTAYTAVPVLEWMDAFKSHMEGNDIF